MPPSARKVLFVSSNDGSDMRINKEVRTLSRQFEIFYLGVGLYSDKNYCSGYCKEFILIDGKRNHPVTIMYQFYRFIQLILTRKVDSIHIINEQLMVFFYPFLFSHHVVLDLFDSIFLRIGKLNNRWELIKRIVYLPVNAIVVTDKNRRTLLPDFIKSRSFVLPNYPNFVNLNPASTSNNNNHKIRIFYGGSLSVKRGTNIIKDLVDLYPGKVQVYMAGWLADEETVQLAKHSSVQNLGVIKQQEAQKIAAQCDFILCLYMPDNKNNINASPNKIWDAIHCNTPVIINKEVLAVSIVRTLNLGVVIDSFDIKAKELYAILKSGRGKFSFEEGLKEQYSWERVETVLLEAHKR